MPEAAKSYRLIEMRVENFKRIVAATITPSGPLTAIVGKNGAGKTSALDALEAAIGGGRHCPTMPLRAGALEGRVIVNLDSIIVERKFRDGKEDVIEVRTGEGAKFSSPQKLLDSLMGKLGFDPLEFDRMESKDQAATMAKLAGIDLDKFQGRREAVEQDRKMAKRQHTEAKLDFDRMPVPGDSTPAEEVSLSEIAEELAQAEAKNRETDAATAKAKSLAKEIEAAKARIDTLSKRPAELQSEKKVAIENHVKALSEAMDASTNQQKESVAIYDARVAEIQNMLATSKEDHERRLSQIEAGHKRRIETLKSLSNQIDKEFEEKIAAAEGLTNSNRQELEMLTGLAESQAKTVETLKRFDIEPIRKQLQQSEVLNRQVRQKQTWLAKRKAVKDAEEKVESLNSKVKSIDQEKIDAIAAAELPVPGLSLNDGGVTLKGIPFEQCSAAEKLRVSVGIALKMNPTLRIMLIRDGSLLDEDGMALLAELAEKHDAQILIERVAADGEIGIWITDGMTEDAAAENAAKAEAIT